MTDPPLRQKPDLASLAGQVRAQMQLVASAEVYPDFAYPSLWGEFCHWIQYRNQGPISDTAWEQSVGALVWGVVEDVSPEDFAALTELAQWEVGAFDEADTGGLPRTDRSLIERAVFSSLCRLAADSDISRHVPAGLRDHYL